VAGEEWAQDEEKVSSYLGLADEFRTSSGGRGSCSNTFRSTWAACSISVPATVA